MYSGRVLNTSLIYTNISFVPASQKLMGGCNSWLQLATREDLMRHNYRKKRERRLNVSSDNRAVESETQSQ